MVSFLFSCNDESAIIEPEASIFTEEALSIDKDFVHFIDVQRNLTNQFEKKMQSLDKLDKKNTILQLQEIGNKSTPTEKDIRKAAEILGFNQYEDYLSYRQDLTKTVKNLTTSYSQLKSMNTESQTVIEGATRIIMDRKFYKLHDPDACDRQYNNCVNSAWVGLSAATLACSMSLLLPVTALAAPICEAIALADHYYKVEACGISYEQCMNK